MVARDLEPVSVFISRKTQHLYVRQSFEQIMDVPITIRDPDRPIGTHIFTAMDRTGDHGAIAWTVVSLQHGLADAPSPSMPSRTHHPGGHDVQLASVEIGKSQIGKSQIGARSDKRPPGNVRANRGNDFTAVVSSSSPTKASARRPGEAPTWSSCQRRAAGRDRDPAPYPRRFWPLRRRSLLGFALSPSIVFNLVSAATVCSVLSFFALAGAGRASASSDHPRGAAIRRRELGRVEIQDSHEEA